MIYNFGSSLIDLISSIVNLLIQTEKNKYLYHSLKRYSNTSRKSNGKALCQYKNKLLMERLFFFFEIEESIKTHVAQVAMATLTSLENKHLVSN